MTALDVLFHLLNFALPALFVGGALALWGKRYDKKNIRKTWLINSLAGIVAMIAGLMVFGVDGKMLSYALLLMACSLSQLLISRRK
jgi:peptidoglycan/LPS O-acetylase OafA/YrhL